VCTSEDGGRTDGAAELDHADVGNDVCTVNWHGRDALDPFSNGRRQMRYHLYRPTQVVAAALLGNHVGVHFTGRDIVIPCQGHIQETLVVSQIQVDLTAIIENKALDCVMR
jgi:hypothetical protein